MGAVAILAASAAAGAGAQQGPKLFGQRRKIADDFVGSYQDPFHAEVATIIDPITEARKAGKLKYEDVTSAQSNLEARIKQFESDQADYEKLGSKQAMVVAKSRETLDPIIASWRTSLANDLSTLPAPGKPEDNPALTPPTMTSILAPEGTTPKKKAEGAADQAKKRAMGAKGRSSTILTSSRGLTSAPTRQPTLLGY